VAGLPLTQPWLHLGVLLVYAVVGYVVATICIRRRLIR
jgi:lipooligosaccharide transport system permease protein